MCVYFIMRFGRISSLQDTYVYTTAMTTIHFAISHRFVQQLMIRHSYTDYQFKEESGRESSIAISIPSVEPIP